MTNKFIGTKCIVCSEMFSERDDIVVCPQCGTPYHRGCWQENGHCVNHELHENGASWQPEHEQRQDSETAEELRCPRCGSSNLSDKQFCEQCGLPLNTEGDAERPFNQSWQRESDSFNNAQNGGTNAYKQYGNSESQQKFDFSGSQQQNNRFSGINAVRLTPESDMNGIRLGDFFDYIGKRSVSLIMSFVRFAKTNAKTSFNVFAFIFPEYYFFYRKMYKQGAFFLITTFLFSIPQLLYYGQSGAYGIVFFNTSIDMSSDTFAAIYNICSTLSLAASIVAGLFANYWYYVRARRDIEEIRGSEPISENAAAMIVQKGGISWKNVIAAVIASLILTLLFMLAMSFMFGV